MARLCSHRALRNHLIVDIKLSVAKRLAVLPRLFSNESHAQRVLAGSESLRDELLFRLDAEEVVYVVQLSILDERDVTAETRAMRKRIESP